MTQDLTLVSRWRGRLEVAALAIFIIVCVAVLYRLAFGDLRGSGARTTSAASTGRPNPVARRAEPPLPTQPVSLDRSVSRGSVGARFAVIEYSEFQCPWCERFFRDTFPDINRDYIDPGLVLFVFRHLPLEKIHSFAMKAAEGAECAGRQGKFWPMHDLIFLNPRLLDVPNLHKHAARLRLDTDAFAACLKSGEMATKIRQDLADATLLGITGTPTFLIGTIESGDKVRISRRLSGARPFADFKLVLDELVGIRSAQPK